MPFSACTTEGYSPLPPRAEHSIPTAMARGIIQLKPSAAARPKGFFCRYIFSQWLSLCRALVAANVVMRIFSSMIQQHQNGDTFWLFKKEVLSKKKYLLILGTHS